MSYDPPPSTQPRLPQQATSELDTLKTDFAALQRDYDSLVKKFDAVTAQNDAFAVENATLRSQLKEALANQTLRPE